jgi:hypothetical protein
MTKIKSDQKTKEESEVIENQMCIQVHEMLHDLILVLNQKPRGIGTIAMMELIVTHSPLNKEELIEHISRVWDAYHEDKHDIK